MVAYGKVEGLGWVGRTRSVNSSVDEGSMRLRLGWKVEGLGWVGRTRSVNSSVDEGSMRLRLGWLSLGL